jgi:CheY-like chemotaxis protein
MIETSGKRLMDTINSILDMAKIEANRVELNPTEVIVEDEIRKVVDMLRPLAVQKGIGLRLDIHKRDISGEIDAHYFGRILTNIIGNAVKFTKEGFVAVELDRMQSLESDAVADGIRVRVRDSGVGISEDFLPHIFDEFKQESSGWSRDFEGTGLGLTLSKHLVELMSGNITVESKRGEGSTFTIELPLKNLHIPFENIRANDSEWATKIRSERTSASTCVDHQIHVTNSVSAAKRRLSRVLLVEDNYESARLTTILLSEVCSVDHASDIASAGALLEANRYELILMDVNLKSGQSGLDLTKALRQIARHQTIPIIALTAYAMKGDRESALSAGCDDYLSKPFTKDQLVDAVTAQLSKTLASIPSANY